MIIYLYNSTAEEIKLNKSGDLSLVLTLNGTLRSECDIIDPSILIESATLPVFNYVYIPEFNRHYFLRKITTVSNSLWQIDLHVDVLMSYKDAILRLKADVSRNEFDYDLLLEDGMRDNESKYDLTIVEPSAPSFWFDLPSEYVYNVEKDKLRYLMQVLK